MDEHIRHRAVERLEGEPSQVARTSAEGHLGHSLRREACDEAVAQVASAVDVDVVPARTERKWKCSEAPFIGLCGYCRLPSCICDSRRLSSCLAAPMGAEPASLSQKVTIMSFVKARAAVTLCSATPGGTVDCCVCTVERAS